MWSEIAKTCAIGRNFAVEESKRAALGFVPMWGAPAHRSRSAIAGCAPAAVSKPKHPRWSEFLADL